MTPKIIPTLKYASIIHTFDRHQDDVKAPYINHLISILNMLFLAGIEDECTLLSSILKDTLKNRQASETDILSIFGADVLMLVKDLQSVNIDKLKQEELMFADKRIKVIVLATIIDTIHSLDCNIDFYRSLGKACSGVNNHLDRLLQDKLNNTLKRAS